MLAQLHICRFLNPYEAKYSPQVPTGRELLIQTKAHLGKCHFSHISQISNWETTSKIENHPSLTILPVLVFKAYCC